MKRWMLRLAIVISAAACALSLLAWVRSYAPEDLAVRSYRGRVLLVFTDGSFTGWNDAESKSYRSAPGVWADFHRMAQSQWGVLGFAYAAADFPNASFRLVAIPYPVVVLATAAGPLWWGWRVRRARTRSREGRCAKCGYDLRESQERCPECGSPAVAAEAAPAP
jgi:hypothetical protein